MSNVGVELSMSLAEVIHSPLVTHLRYMVAKP